MRRIRHSPDGAFVSDISLLVIAGRSDLARELVFLRIPRQRGNPDTFSQLIFHTFDRVSLPSRIARMSCICVSCGVPPLLLRKKFVCFVITALQLLYPLVMIVYRSGKHPFSSILSNNKGVEMVFESGGSYPRRGVCIA